MYILLLKLNHHVAGARVVLEELMSVSHTRKLCFDGQELIQNLILHFGYNHSTGICQWEVGSMCLLDYTMGCVHRLKITLNDK